jgi:prolipoprotein diacylglyceryltransferase
MNPKNLVYSVKELDENLKKAADAATKGGCAKRHFEQMKAPVSLLRQHLLSFPTSPAEAAQLAKRQDLRSPYLHPAQLYSAIGPLLLAWLTNALFYRRKRHGVVFAIGFMLYAVERFIEESLRVDNPVDTFGLTISQAISVVIFIVMGVWLLVLRKMPLRSPRAVAFVPKDAKPKPEAPTAATA